jgi:hypothetical protein
VPPTMPTAIAPDMSGWALGQSRGEGRPPALIVTKPQPWLPPDPSTIRPNGPGFTIGSGHAPAVTWTST